MKSTSHATVRWRIRSAMKKTAPLSTPIRSSCRPAGGPVAGTPGSYLKAWEVRFDGPVAPVDGTVQRDGRALEPDLVVLARGDRAAAEVEPPRADGRVEQLGELRRHRPAKRKAV